MQTKNKADKHFATHPLNTSTQHSGHRSRQTPARLNPLAAALVLALNGMTSGALPTLGAVTAGGFLMVVARDARAQCVLSAPFVNYTCTGSSSGTLGGRLDGLFLGVLPIDTYTIYSGNAQANMVITTTSDRAAGIAADLRGEPSGVVLDFIPEGDGGSSAPVRVESRANIATHGANAIGILAQSQAGGIPLSAIPEYRSLLVNNGVLSSAFYVSQVEGQASNVGSPVAGKSLVDRGGLLTQVNGGTFTIAAGAPVFDPGHDFDDLAIGESRTSTVSYDVGNAFIFNRLLPASSATLVATVTKTGTGFTTVFGVNFAQYGNSSVARAQTSLLPDVPGYYTRYLENLALNGAANTVTVNSAGTIDTFGQGSHGIFAQSKGGLGLNGDDSLGSGDPGQPGRAGGLVDVTNHSAITTRGLSANGIVARSVGNTGGTGGDSDIVGSGGAGGGGGAGGEVLVNNNGDIVTRGALSTAIIAQSLGGSAGEGGDGGWIYGNAGGGGFSGFGGRVAVHNNGNLTTTGAQSLGIFAQSVGGFAGAGGDAEGFFSFGADGGSSGRGGQVEVINNGDIRTTAEAIFAQSIGGGGGNAGIGNGKLFTGGGDGRRGGDGGAITITNSGRLETSQSNAMGISAQSIGGGGGNGGSSETAGFLLGQALGGNGSAAGNGGVITINNNDSAVVTRGDFAHGLYGLSVGGGGGFAGDAKVVTKGDRGANVSFAAGGDGGSGGRGESVHINSSGSIQTTGLQAFGIGAQSIGGGGGSGGSAMSFAGSYMDLLADGTAPIAQFSAALSLGGRGSVGGSGGAVNVGTFADPVTGTIQTSGFRSYGILAQSVGGGGGDGGFSASGAITLGIGRGFSVALGGDGGAGGNGGIVRVHNRSAVATGGDFAYGILAQSIGGGGGSGGSSLALTLEGFPQIASASTPFAIALGGIGGAGGVGNAVAVGGDQGSIHTRGAFAHGVLAQSVGGGGGAGGQSVGTSLGLFFDSQSMNSSIGLGGWSVGGVGGSGQNGGSVTVDIQADITTEKNFANGILAQSVGGGGGAGGVSFTTDLGPMIAGLTTGQLYQSPLQGAFRRSGNGAAVRVDSTGDITTQGAFAHGILAQSIGGGGGVSGINISNPALAGSVNLIASAGTVSSDSGMMFAGTTGGVGSGGTVSVEHNGNITAMGAHSDGIYAQSVGSGGSTRNNISVSIDNGTVQGGSGASAGISIHEGLNNAVNIRANGAVTTQDAWSFPTFSAGGNGPYAITGTSGNETVNNFGAVIGSVNLGSGSNAFNNLATGRLFSGHSVVLGAGSLLSNAGTLSPGGAGVVQRTAVHGSLQQTDTGVFEVDVDLTALTADSIAFTGSAELAGTARVSAINTRVVPTGVHTMALVTASGGLSGTFSTTDLPSTAVLNYDMAYFGGTAQLVLTARALDAVLAPGTSSAAAGVLGGIDPASMSADLQGVLIELQSLPDAQSVGNALRTLGPEAHDSVTRATSIGLDANSSQLSTRLGGLRTSRAGATRSAEAFVPVVLAATGDVNSLMDGAGKAFAPRHGLWLESFGKTGTQADEAGGFTGFKLRSNGLTVGYDQALGEHSVVGAAFGYARTRLDFNGQSARGEIGNHALSLYGSWDKDGQYVQGILSYGNVKYEQSRNVIVGGISRLAVSQHRGKTVAADLEAGFMSPSGNWSRGPYAAARFASIREEAFSETGAGGLSLLMAGKNTDTLNAELGFRAERASAAGNGELVVGLTAAWLHDFAIDDRTLSASYDGASGNAFAIPGLPAARNGAKLGASLSYVDRAGWMAALRYQFEVREGFRSHGLAGEMRLSF